MVIISQQLTPHVDLPGVGFNLQDHSSAVGCYVTNKLQPGKVFDDLVVRDILFYKTLEI